MKIKNLPCKIVESRNLMELMGLRVCIAVLDDIEGPDAISEIRLHINARIEVLLGSEL